MAKLVNVETKKEFNDIIRYNKKVLVDFWAPWCGPCRMIAPAVEDIAEEDNGIVVVKVNTDENQALAERMGVRSIPTIKSFVDGEETNTKAGALSKKTMLEMFT